MKDKKFTITLNENQMRLLKDACDFMARTRCGQLYIGPLQYELQEMYKKVHPENKIGSDEWHNMRDKLEATMMELQANIFHFLPGQTGGIHFDDRADNLIDIQHCIEHALYLSRPEAEREALKWTLAADEPRQYGSEELIKIKEI